MLYDNGYIKPNFQQVIINNSSNQFKSYSYEFAFRGEFKEQNEVGGTCYMTAMYGHDFTTIEGCLKAFCEVKSDYDKDRIACYISVHNKTLNKNVSVLIQNAKKIDDLYDYGLYIQKNIKMIEACIITEMSNECRNKMVSYEKQYEEILEQFRNFKKENTTNKKKR